VKVRVLPLQQFWLKRIRRLPGIVPFGIESLRKKMPGIRGIQKGETDITQETIEFRTVTMANSGRTGGQESSTGDAPGRGK
jgi:hypothetical protein